jgi:putative transposase
MDCQAHLQGDTLDPKGSCQAIRKWHHAPEHRFFPGAYMVTAGTFGREALFNTHQKLALLQGTLFEMFEAYDWRPQAWAVFPNHYHFVAFSAEDPTTLAPMLQRLHSQTARVLNDLDARQTRKVWFQYWDTCLTYERSYYARLSYVHNNPVKHGYAARAELYPFCSAPWFVSTAPAGMVRKVLSFRYDRIKVPDNF